MYTNQLFLCKIENINQSISSRTPRKSNITPEWRQTLHRYYMRKTCNFTNGSSYKLLINVRKILMFKFKCYTHNRLLMQTGFEIETVKFSLYYTIY